MKILIADDQAIVRQMIINMTKGTSYEYVEASNGREGLDALDEHEDISLILLDMNMPSMDGLEMLEELKKNPVHAITPVIFISSVRSDECIEKAESLGIVQWLSKPFKRDELLAAIDKALQGFMT